MNTSIAIEEETSAKVLKFKPFSPILFYCFVVFLIKNSSIKVFVAAKRSSFKMFVVLTAVKNSAYEVL